MCFNFIGEIMHCPQCNEILVEPRGLDKYCEECGFPEENRAVFTLVEIKAYLRSMFANQMCAEDVRPENMRLACAYNLLLDEHNGIVKFCDDGKADGLELRDFAHVPM